MDFGALDGLVVCSNNNNTNNNATNPFLTSSTNSDPDQSKPKWYGSTGDVTGGGFLRQLERTSGEDEWRDSSKVAKTSDDFSLSKAMLFQQQRSNSSLLSHNQQNMLSFSSPNSPTLPSYYPTANAYARNAGYGSGGGLLRGPFTPSQWMELEHQALIYKYITANAPIPSDLLIPIRKALETAGFSTFPGGHLRHNTFGWGALHLGFSSNSDPEPGRCRRTDGKKWRCSRDAVADQKYCERHMNRGRHRSRKPVEGQNGHSVSGGAGSGPTTTTAAAKLMPMAQLNSSTMKPVGTTNSPTPSQLNRSYSNPNKASQDHATGFSMPSPSIGLKDNHQLSILKPSEEHARSEFGLVCSDSLLNPLHKNNSISLVNCKETKSQQNSLRQFMDDWPQTERTQLSISIPTDFMSSSTSSPTNESRLTLSPLRLSRELEPTQMGLGMGTMFNEPNQRQANWIPISWETSVGGPLGEVLHNSSTNSEMKNNTSALNLMTEGWDSSPRMALSPTGVLQKTVFGSLSNSSAGSSPRTENNLLGSSTFISSSLPLL